MYDIPTSTFARLIVSGYLISEQVGELEAYKTKFDLVVIAAEIDRIQQRLIKLAARKATRMEHEIKAAQTLPDSSGVRSGRPGRGKDISRE